LPPTEKEVKKMKTTLKSVALAGLMTFIFAGCASTLTPYGFNDTENSVGLGKPTKNEIITSEVFTPAYFKESKMKEQKLRAYVDIQNKIILDVAEPWGQNFYSNWDSDHMNGGNGRNSVFTDKDTRTKMTIAAGEKGSQAENGVIIQYEQTGRSEISTYNAKNTGDVFVRGSGAYTTKMGNYTKKYIYKLTPIVNDEGISSLVSTTTYNCSTTKKIPNAKSTQKMWDVTTVKCEKNADFKEFWTMASNIKNELKAKFASEMAKKLDEARQDPKSPYYNAK
jgi:hypothetical protein